MKHTGVPGLSIAIIRDARVVWTQGFGVRNVETGELVTVDTPFEAASFSKAAFAYATLRSVVQARRVRQNHPRGNELGARIFHGKEVARPVIPQWLVQIEQTPLTQMGKLAPPFITMATRHVSTHCRRFQKSKSRRRHYD